MKVTIPQDVAWAIDNCRANQMSNGDIVEYRFTGLDPVSEDAQRLRSIPFSLLFDALVDGYDVGTAKETDCLKTYGRIQNVYMRRLSQGSKITHQPDEYSLGFADGIKFALNELGTKLEGVNA